MDLHRLDHLPTWEKMLKITVFEAFQEVRGKRILDFGSGDGRECLLLRMLPEKRMTTLVIISQKKAQHLCALDTICVRCLEIVRLLVK